MAIKTKTTFVLGAGASSHAGFPLGVQLRNLVCTSVTRGDVRQILLELGHTASQLDEFTRELRYSGHRSVDVFLERNPSFLELGKQALAATLMPFETEDRLFPPGAVIDHWYEFLAGRMGAGTDDWGHNRLSIVTFNYDRSLEHYFSRVIAQRLRVSLSDAYSVFSTVPIVHVHGILGEYCGNDAGLIYGAALQPQTVSDAARRILVVSEVEDTLPTFAEAHRLLLAAKRIMFLGFGFNPDNVRRLRFFDEQTDGASPEIIGTTIGYSDREWATVRDSVLQGRWTGNPYAGSVSEFFLHRTALE